MVRHQQERPPQLRPDYIKLDPETYGIVRGIGGVAMPSLSPHCIATLERDKQAFCKVMAFLKHYDGEECSVVGVKIENEMGLGGTDRDYSALTCADYEKAVPEAIRGVELEDAGAYAGSHDGAHDGAPDGVPTWRGTFGRHAHEAFCAWYHALSIGAIAEAGRAI